MNRTVTRKSNARNVRAVLMAEIQREEIPKRIKQAREEAGLTQAEMADAINVGGRTYQNYESNRIPWGALNNIAEVTGKQTEWLIHGAAPKAPDLMEAFASDEGGPLIVRLDLIHGELRRIAELLEVDASIRDVEAAAHVDGARPPGEAAG